MLRLDRGCCDPDRASPGWSPKRPQTATLCALDRGPRVSRQCSPASRDGNHSDVQTGHLLQCRHQPHHIVHVALTPRPLAPFGQRQFVADCPIPVGDRLQVGNKLFAC
jgi:hypothetical protein